MSNTPDNSGSGNSGVTLDFSKSQPLDANSGVSLDFAHSEPIDKQSQPTTQPQAYGKAIVPAMGGGFLSVDVPAGEERKYEQAHLAGYTEGGKAGLSMLGAAAAPELLPETEGGGLLGYLGRIFSRSLASGAGAGAGNAAGQALSGENPISPDNLKQTGIVAGTTAALALPLETIGQMPFSKFGRSAINQSLGAQARDVTYGNPAVALTQEGISDVSTGDWQAYRQALLAGKSPLQASQAAGGRFAAVNQRIAELTPRLNNVLSQSNALIPVSDAIDAPLNDSALQIISNPALTDAEKDAAINQLGALQKSVKQGLGANATPSQLQAIKQAIGNRVNWGGNISVSDDVKPAYRALYGSLKDAIHSAVPESADLDERLSNLLAAHSDLDNLSRAEEVGRGGGLFSGGKIGTSVIGLAERSAGRVLPMAAGAPAATPLGTGFISLADVLARPTPQQ